MSLIQVMSNRGRKVNFYASNNVCDYEDFLSGFIRKRQDYKYIMYRTLREGTVM